MVLLVITTRILSAIESIPPSSREELSLPSSPALEGPISHEQLIAIARYFRESQKEQGNAAVDHENDQHTQTESPSPSPLPSPTQCLTLNELLRGTKVYIPPPPKKPEPVCFPIPTSERSSERGKDLINAEPRIPRPKSKAPCRPTNRRIQPSNLPREESSHRPLADILLVDADGFRATWLLRRRRRYPQRA